MRLTAGASIGPYTIVSAIGAGAMGEVYRAHDPRLGRDVAIKVLSSHRTSDRDQQRFLQEARSASSLSHPNVVTVHEVGEHESIRYVVMELVEGERLRDVLRRGPVPLRRALQIARSIASGLYAAHSRGVIHRDLKPENVMISNDGLVKLVDFGLARVDSGVALETDETAEMPDRLTQEGTVVGTVGYMSPEQLSRSVSDARSDQFAFGVVLHEMLSGSSPFERELPLETMYAILREKPAALRDVPPEVAGIVARCLEKNPNDRFTSAGEIAAAIDGILEGFTASGSGSQQRRFQMAVPKRRVAVAAVLALVVAGAGYHAVSRSTTTGSLPASKQLAIVFTQVGGDADSRLWADGLTQVIGARLGHSGGLQVITPFDAMTGARSNAGELARDAGANLLLRGTVHRDRARTRISYALTDPASGRQLAAAVLTGTNEDIFDLQDELAERVAKDLQLGTTTSQPLGPTSAEGQDDYLKALGLLQRYEDRASVERAVALLEELTAESPGSAALHAAAGRAHLALYELTFQPASAEAAGRHAGTAARIDPSLAEVRAILGELALHRGDTASAVSEFRRLVEQAPESAPAVLSLADAYAADGQNAKAEQQYKRAISLRPGYWAGHNRAGYFYAQRGDIDSAIKSFQTAAALSPGNPRVEANLGAVYVQAGRLREAVTLLEKAAAEVPTSEIWSNLGTTRYLLGEFDAAVPAYERATELTPADPLLWANLGDALRWSSSRRQDARAAFGSAIVHGEASLRMNPGDAILSAVVAGCYAKSGAAEKAREYVRRAVALAPEDPTVNYHAAVATAVIGDDADAVALLDTAFRTGYPHTEAERERELVKVRETPAYRQLIARVSSAADPAG